MRPQFMRIIFLLSLLCLVGRVFSQSTEGNSEYYDTTIYIPAFYYVVPIYGNFNISAVFCYSQRNKNPIICFDNNDVCIVWRPVYWIKGSGIN